MSAQTVLVIDDSATIVKVVQLVLGKAGYRVHGASSGEDGLAVAERLRPDLVLLDFVMPGMNGYQVCRAMSESTALCEVPIVLMSAKADQIGERFVKVMGIVDYITKPFTPDALLAVVANTLERARSVADVGMPDAGDRTSEVALPAARHHGYSDVSEQDLRDEDLDEDEDEDDDDDDDDDGLGPADLAADDDSGVGESAGDDSAEDEDERTDSRPVIAGPSSAAVEASSTSRAARTSRARSLAALRDAVALAAAADDLVGDEIADRVRSRLTDEILEEAVGRWLADGAGSAAAATTDPSDRLVVADAPALAGDLARVPLTQVLGLLDEQRQSGVLVVRRLRPPLRTDGRAPVTDTVKEQRVEIWLRKGRVDFAGSDGLGNEFLLGNYLLEREAMSREDLDLFLRSRVSSTRLIGEQLVKLDYITDEDLRLALARQTAERIYEVLRWSSGRFVFRANVPVAGEAATRANLQLCVEGILVEGFRRMDEWHLIEREIDDLDAVFLPLEEVGRRLAPGQLTREEAAVLELVDGRNAVRDIVRQSRMGNFEVSRLLYRLKSVRLIRRRVQPIAVREMRARAVRPRPHALVAAALVHPALSPAALLPAALLTAALLTVALWVAPPSAEARRPLRASAPVAASTTHAVVVLGPSTVDVSIVDSGSLTQARVEGTELRLRYSLVPDRVLLVSVLDRDRIVAAARRALADPNPRSRCDGGEVMVSVTVDARTRSAALCARPPRPDDDRWRALVELLRQLAAPAGRPR